METDSQKLERIFKTVALEEGFKQETVEDIFKKFWRSVRGSMNSEDLPRIIIKEFGTFEPSLTHIEKEIVKLENGDKEGKEERIASLRKVIERIKKEDLSRGHLSGEEGEVHGSPSD